MAPVPPSSRHGYKRPLDLGKTRPAIMLPECLRSDTKESQKAAHHLVMDGKAMPPFEKCSFVDSYAVRLTD